MFLLKLILIQEITPKKDKSYIFFKLFYLLVGLFMIAGGYIVFFGGKREFIAKIPFTIRILFFAYFVLSYLSINPYMDYLDQQDSILMSWFLYPLNLGVLVLFGPLVLLYN